MLRLKLHAFSTLAIPRITHTMTNKPMAQTTILCLRWARSRHVQVAAAETIFIRKYGPKTLFKPNRLTFSKISEFSAFYISTNKLPGPLNIKSRDNPIIQETAVEYQVKSSTSSNSREAQILVLRKLSLYHGTS